MHMTERVVNVSMTIAQALEIIMPGPANLMSLAGTSKLLQKKTIMELSISKATHK